MNVNIKLLDHAKGLPLPEYKTDGASGFDLAAAIPESATVILAPGERYLVDTGICVAIPQGYEGQVRPRSGLAAKAGLTVLNTPGTIDSDYRGEIKVILINHSSDVAVVERGMRIAQMVIAPVIRATITEVEDLEETVRGEGGFGSTGLTS